MDIYLRLAFIFWIWFIIAGVLKSMNMHNGFLASIAVFVLVLFIHSFNEFSFNCSSVKSKSGVEWFTSAMSMTFQYTMAPVLVMFISIVVLVLNVPVWSSPFSNTVGYFAVKSEVASLMDSVLKKPTDDGLSPVKRNLLEKLYSDRSLFINILTPENFDQTYDNLMSDRDIVSDQNVADLDDTKMLIRDQVNVKTAIGQMIWLCLAGLTTISTISTNVNSIDCD